MRPRPGTIKIGIVILPEIAASDKGETTFSLDGGAMPECVRAPAAGLATRGAEHCSQMRSGAPLRPRHA